MHVTWLKTDLPLRCIIIMYPYLTSFVTAISSILFRINLTTLNIGLLIFNLVWTYAVRQYLIVKRGRLFRQQFARRKEIAEDNEELQTLRWQRTTKKLQNHQGLRNKQEAIGEFLTQARVLGGRTHKIKTRKRWFFSR